LFLLRIQRIYSNFALEENVNIMAMAISNIPVLTGDAADSFVSRARYVEEHLRGFIDLRSKKEMCRNIMKKAHLI